MTSRGGSAATATDEEIFAALDLLGATEGILTEPAGGTMIAGTMKLANEGKIGPDDTVVAIIRSGQLPRCRADCRTQRRYWAWTMTRPNGLYLGHLTYIEDRMTNQEDERLETLCGHIPRS